MSKTTQVSEWLEHHGFDDQRLTLAYESAGDYKRAVLKQTIARQHQVWGERHVSTEIQERTRQGFTVTIERRPVSWVLALCDPEFSHPAALVAALMPAVLAGVERIIPCFLHKDAQNRGQDAEEMFRMPSDGLLAACELCGMETVCAACTAEVEELFFALDHELGEGILLLLGGPGFADSIARSAHRTGRRIRFLGDPSSLPTSQLELDAAHAGIWFWPDLPPEWFINVNMRFRAL